MASLYLVLACIVALQTQICSSLDLSLASMTTAVGPRLPSSTCQGAGLQCTSCSQLSLCVETNAGFVEFAAELCNTSLGSYCSSSLRKCDTKKSYCSLDTEFECRDIGVFPDPFDCNVYYNCTLNGNGNLQAELRNCPPSTAFNPKTYECDLSDSDAICGDSPVPECPETGFSVGVVPSNPNLYYVCDEGVPQLFKCLAGEDYIFDLDLLRCVPRGEETTTEINTDPTTPPPSTTPTTTTTTTTTQTPHENCTYGTWHPIPYTCYQYYVCTYMPSPIFSGQCGDDYYFDRNTRECEKGECPYPDEWKLICPNVEKRYIPVPKVCNMYYNCQAIYSSVQVIGCNGYFDRDLGKCAEGECPYTDL